MLLHTKEQTLGAYRGLKQFRAEKMLLGTVLEITLEMEEKFGVLMYLETINEQLLIVKKESYSSFENHKEHTNYKSKRTYIIGIREVEIF